MINTGKKKSVLERLQNIEEKFTDYLAKKYDVGAQLDTEESEIVEGLAELRESIEEENKLRNAYKKLKNR